MRLSPAHKRMLFEESALGARVAVKRGYRTVTSKAELECLGFGKSQRNVPALLVPIYGPSGEISLYQSRPDEPRIGKRGKPVKYETPTGASMALDVHPVCQNRLGDRKTPLFITEGVKKGDALASHGLCAVALIGVWNWRGTNEQGGKTALAEWEYVALNGRKVYIVFDSDVMEKPEVYAALSRLKAWLENRGAVVRLIYLPAGDGGINKGVDDYLAAGHTVDDLLRHATSELKSPPQEDRPESPYRATPGGLVWGKPTQNGAVSTPLTNFTARITGDVAEDDGAEVRRRFEIEAELNGRRTVFTIPSSQFSGMGWATEHLGAGAIVYPGFGVRDHARAAVQMLSGDVPTRNVYAHTGWRLVDGEWVYLHAGGAIGRVESIHVELTGSLAGRTLPDPPDGAKLLRALQSSLKLWKLAPESIVVPLHAGTCRAALGESDFTIHLSGPTGEGKSELAALFQQHFGPKLDARHLTSWESTENAIEGQAFQAKDQVVVLDDFAPTGSSYDVQRWHRKADRVLRAKGNASGRQRMRPDTTLRPEKPPRALVLSTGEDVPRGQSLRARMLVLELAPGQLDWHKLSRCQKDAADGLYAQAMASFVRWLALRYEQLRSGLNAEHVALREAASTSTQHKRTPGIMADLALGLRYFLLFANEVGAVSEAEAEELWVRGWLALGEAAADQSQHQAASEPTRRFRELLTAAVASGRAHLAGPNGHEPASPEAWGWRLSGEEWRPQGERVGWVDGEDLYLEPEASFAAVQKQGRDSGEALAVTGRTLRKRLHERGLLTSTDSNRQTLTVRRTFAGSRKDVLHTSKDFLSTYTDQPDLPDHGGENPFTYTVSVPPLWSGYETLTRPAPDHGTNQEPQSATDGRVSGEHWSGNGQEPDRQVPLIHAGNPADGRVGRVVDEGREKDSGEGTRTRRVRGRI
jgi:Domain of unknown function (DUF3854)/Domain of unknown function (DUF927)